VTQQDERSLRHLTRAAFGQRRKQFQRILRDAYGLSVEQVAALGAEVGMDLQSRPESFAPERFVDLARALRERSALPPAVSAGESEE
jgi:16S rRNA A1518/A1519 N6-dimethyltransferase RsmA/KsgA/DIM1 with predicted DNA glycosylase/AP lyase activity